MRSTKKVPRNKKRPNYLMLFYLFVASMLVSGSATYALRTPNLNVKEVKICGVHLCRADAVSAAAKPALGKNIILLRKSPIASRIQSLSEVREVKIGRTYPDKVWIKVEERTACAVISDGSDYCLAQSDGFVFHKGEGPAKGLPLVRVSENRPICVGQKACSPDVRCALEVLKCARERGIKLDKISVDHEGDICLNMESDFEVRLGQPDDIARKMTLLRSTLDCRPSIAREASYIDLSCPSAPVWKPKLSVQASS